MSKEQILFITGWGFRASIFKQSECYSKKIILIDLPNLEKLSLNEVVKYLSKIIPKNSIVMGWSLGGLIAIQLASLYPEKIKKLVLLSSSPRFSDDGEWSGIEQNIFNLFVDRAESNIDHLLNYFVSLVNYPNTERDIKKLLTEHSVDSTMGRDYFIRYLKILSESDIRDAYGKIRVPLFHLFGAEDAIINVNYEMLTQLNHRAKIHVISKSGHAFFLSHGKICNNLLTQFFYDS